MASAMTKRRAGAYDQKLAQVAVAHLGDAPKPRFAAGRVLARRQAEEGGELAPAGEGAGVLDRGHDRRCGDRADAGNAYASPARSLRKEIHNNIASGTTPNITNEWRRRTVLKQCRYRL